MFPYLVDFHENIRYSTTLSDYQELPYPLKKTTTAFHNPLRNACNIRRIFIEQEIFLNSMFPEHYFSILSGILWGIFPEYTGNIPWECSTNTP